jgi:hypothetical protein
MKSNTYTPTQAVRAVLAPTGMYKRRRSHDFLARFTELNYRLKYVEGNGVMTFSKQPAKHAATKKKSVEIEGAGAPLAAPSASASASSRPVRKRASPARSSSPP